jgi:hypothetical protein
MIPVAFMSREKPESIAAAEAVQDALSVNFIDGTFSPWEKSNEIKTFMDRLKKEDYPAFNGRPTVVFYSCEGATETTTLKTKAKTERVFELESSRTTIKVYNSIFDVIESRQPCIYTMFVNLVRVDISQTLPLHDPYINKKTGPFMGFFNVDGQCVSIVRGAKIGPSSYTRNIKKLIGNPSASRGRYTKVEHGLDKLEELTREEYLTTMHLEESLKKAARSSSKNKRTMGKAIKSMSTTRSNDAIRAEKLKTKQTEVGKELDAIRSNLHKMTGTAVGCAGCAVCLEKAAAAAAASQTSSY